MKFVVIFFLAFFYSCCGCDEPEEQNQDLAPYEVDEIMIEGFGGYLDSIKSEKLIFYRFTKFLDTSFAENVIYSKEGKKVREIIYPNYRDCAPYGAYYELSEEKIDDYKLPNLFLVDKIDWDSISKVAELNNKNDIPYFCKISCISKPYRPKNAQHAVIAISDMMHFFSPRPMCFMPNCNPEFLFFKQINGQWRFVEGM